MAIEGILGFSLKQTALAFSLLMSLSYSLATECTFPKHWRGRWYQSGLGDITIRSSAISGKGTCLEISKDYYLLENRDRKCKFCLLIIQRHKNVLQYKESFCLPYENLNEVCDQIQVEAHLYTLVKEGSNPVACPFQEAFNFMYNNNTKGDCRHPQSYIKPCASPAKFHFRFRHCNDVPDTNERDVEFECLATWKDGSSMFMYGGFSGSGIIGPNDMYRCFTSTQPNPQIQHYPSRLGNLLASISGLNSKFAATTFDIISQTCNAAEKVNLGLSQMYQSLGTEMHLSMSADASCQGLLSPSEGPLVMELSRDTNGWVEPTCAFPDWLRKSSWRDLSGKHRYDTDPSGRVLSVEYHRHYSKRGHSTTTFRCTNVLEYTSEEFVATSFTSHGCSSYHHCIKFRRLHHNVVQISQGSAHDNKLAQCPVNEVNKTRELLIPEDISQSPCPYKGRFEERTSASSQCTAKLHSGCNGTGLMNVLNTCISERATTLECLSHWKENEKKYVIVRKLDDENNLANCFAFDIDETGMSFYTDIYCNSGADHVFDEAVEYSLQKMKAPCGEEGYSLTGNAPVLAGSSMILMLTIWTMQFSLLGR